jgi:inhibitor of KinA
MDEVNYELLPLGDSAIMIRFGHGIDEATHRKVGALNAYMEEHPFAGMIECVPAFASLAIHYDPVAVMKSRAVPESRHTTIYETVCSRLKLILSGAELSGADTDRRTIEIPVCYGGDFGPDLSFVAMHTGLSEEEVVAIHASGSYLVYMLGFAPGFPYLGGMPDRIAAPRRQTPRTVIPRGSVGIASGQTGVYPLATPGGWQLIGRTPLELFRPREAVPSLLRSGDSVRFKPITKEQYNLYMGEN